MGAQIKVEKQDEGFIMDNQKRGTHRTLQTILTMGVLLLVFFFQGAVAVVGNLDELASAVVRGGIIWALVVITAALYLIKYRRLDLLGFLRPDSGSFRQLYFFIPLIVVALTSFSCGIDADNGMGVIFANLFLTLGIGFCEELYFRGIICNLWMEKGERTAVVISSILFAVCHLMNIAGGAGMVETMLQICFAFVYGIAFALIFVVCHSIWPCIILHTFHDFCSFISADGTTLENIALGAIQFIILLCYTLALIKGRSKSAGPR